MPIDPWMLSAGSALLAVGGAWGGAKAALNGSRERIRHIEEALEAHVDRDDQVQRDLLDRSARVETSLSHLQADITELKSFLLPSGSSTNRDDR